MARDLLTTRTLESRLRLAATEAARRNTRIKIRDGANLMLIVRPRGASWVLEYRHAGQRMPLTLGACPDVSLKIARDLAQDARGLVAKGIDPNVKKRDDLARKKVETEANAYTVHRLFEEWMSKKTGSEVYLGNIQRLSSAKAGSLSAISSCATSESNKRDFASNLWKKDCGATSTLAASE